MMNSKQLAESWQKAVESCNVNAILDCYDENAELKIVDRDHPPSKPMVFRGRQALNGYYSDIFSRDLSHKIEEGAIDDRHIAFTESCEYGDGTKVLVTEMCEVNNGKITKQTSVQAWDS